MSPFRSRTHVKRLAGGDRRDTLAGVGGTWQRMCGIRNPYGSFRSTLLVVLVLAASETAAAEPSFQRDVMAVFSKAGCNSGVCHGNQNGKGGFKLSLRGEDPRSDYETLLKGTLGRRIDLMDPADSLLLAKPTAGVPHQGGRRFTRDSLEYEILRQWIEAGARADFDSAKLPVRLEVAATDDLVFEPGDKTTISVHAVDADGRRRDVTPLVVLEPTQDLVTVEPDGVLRRRAFGECVVLVRYLHLQEPVRITFLPARPDKPWSGPQPANWIDDYVFQKLRRLGIDAAGTCDDSTFVRRTYLDALGVIPTADEARRFVQDSAIDKRAKLIEELLKRPEFADRWALVWSDLLRNEEKVLDVKGVQAFHHWIRRSIADRKPLDQFVRELIVARGSSYLSPAGNFYRANREPTIRAEAAAQTFLGVRLACARCHNHPFDRWTQEDYYAWAGLFTGIRYKIVENNRRDENDHHQFDGEQIIVHGPPQPLVHPRTDQDVAPRALGVRSPDASPNAASIDPLSELGNWLTSPDNPFFARAQANRIWYHLLGRGLVDPVDDFRATNPASHPELLDRLARELAEHQFDLTYLVSLIMNSANYQMAGPYGDIDPLAATSLAHAITRRLPAETLLDAVARFAGSVPRFSGFPEGVRAGQLPGVGAMRARRQAGTPADRFLTTFGKPPRLLTCECERSQDSTLAQALSMVSGPLINDLLSRTNNRLAQLTGSGRPEGEIVDELWWAGLARAPTTAERDAALEMLADAPDRRLVLEDLAWGIMNSFEFLHRQ